MSMYLLRRLAGLLLALPLALGSPAQAWELAGTKTLSLVGREGKATAIGTVEFTTAGGQTTFRVAMNPAVMQDFFLSMREFKCLPGGTEVLCHVPYPYRNPASVVEGDLVWLEYALLFFYKQPTDFGAKLWNGVYYQLARTPQGLVGTPQAIDLNAIGAPPAQPGVPPYGKAERSDIPTGARWFGQLLIQ